jgi:hypothetical protein
MPVKVKRNRSGSYRVTDADRVTAKHTTKAKAEKQARLLRGAARGRAPARRR